MRYRTKPVVIEARQYDGANAESLVEWAAGFTSDPAPLQVLGAQLVIATLAPGDYIIRGVHGEFYPCKPDIFAQTYEPADPPAGELVIDDAKREAEAHVEQLRAGGYEGAVIQEVYLRAPAESGEPSSADAAVRDALDAIKKAHAAVDDLCNGRRWTMSVPARPDADPDLVIGDALTKAERVIRSLDVDADARRLAALHQLVAWWDDTSWGSPRWIAELAAIVENCRAAAMAADTQTDGESDAD